MPRTARASVGGICYHVINRGNAQVEVSHKGGDYQAVVELMGLAREAHDYARSCVLRHAKSSLGFVAVFRR